MSSTDSAFTTTRLHDRDHDPASGSVDGHSIQVPAVPAAVVDGFVRCGARRVYPTGAVLMAQDSAARHLSLIRRGHLKEEHVLPDGRRLIFAIRGPGDLAGDVGWLGPVTASTTAVAMSDVETLVMDRQHFESSLAASSTTNTLLLEYVMARLHAAKEEWIALAACSAQERVNRRILELAERWGAPHEGGIDVTLAISQEELAAWAGVSLQAAVKALASLRSLRVVATGRRRITVLDPDALRERAEGWRAA